MWSTTARAPDVATRISYELTTSPSTQPISRVISTTELECASGSGATLQSIAYVDGLGRARAALATNDPDGAGTGEADWVRSGITTLDKKGSVRRTYQTDYYDGSATDFGAVVALDADTPYAVVRYDAFGRTRGVIAEDGSVAWTSYHELSTDVCDPLDNDPSSEHYRTCSSTIVNGHGWTIDQVLRNRNPDTGAGETYHLWSYYRVDGAVVALVRTNGGSRPSWYTSGLPSEAVVRTFTYDSLGRRLSSDDPDTDNPDPGETEATNSWRYLYNEVNDLVAVRDPRGCGQNFFYDHAGRLRGEQYVSCSEAQSFEAENPPSSASGMVALAYDTGTYELDVLYHYDDYGEQLSWLGTALSGPAAGRATGVTDRGQRAAVGYDNRGNAVETQRQMAFISDELALGSIAVPSVNTDPYYDRPTQTETGPTQSDVAYDSSVTYTRTATFDHAGRPKDITLPADPDYSGTAPTVGGSLTYNARGLPASATATIGSLTQPIVSEIDYLRDGLVSSITYGDDDDGAGTGRSATVSTTSYDVRRRPTRMTTTRVATGMSDLDAVLTVVDQQLYWDAANNLTAIIDNRDPAEWPAGHRPAVDADPARLALPRRQRRLRVHAGRRHADDERPRHRLARQLQRRAGQRPDAPGAGARGVAARPEHRRPRRQPRVGLGLPREPDRVDRRPVVVLRPLDRSDHQRRRRVERNASVGDLPRHEHRQHPRRRQRLGRSRLRGEREHGLDDRALAVLERTERHVRGSRWLARRAAARAERQLLL